MACSDQNLKHWDMTSKTTLCTVVASSQIIPGYESYSLGKLSKEIGIQIENRHRAGGDALATTKLFEILFKKDKATLTC